MNSNYFWALLILLIPLAYFRATRSGNMSWIDKGLYYASYFPVLLISYALGFAVAWNPAHSMTTSNGAGIVALLLGFSIHTFAIKRCTKRWSLKNNAEEIGG